MGFFTWIGRVTLWVFFLPLGIWRSIVHSRKKSEKRADERNQQLINEIRKSEGPPV